MIVVAVVFAGVVGLAIGSFLDVVAYRVPRGISLVHPGSFCPSCRRPLTWYENVPAVSWLALRGRCRTCRTPIPARAIAVEIGTAALFCLVAAVVRPDAAVPGCCVLVATGMAMAATAADGSRPPSPVATLGTAAGGAALAVAAGVTGGWNHLVGAGIGAGAAGLVDLVGTALVRRHAAAVADGLVALLPLGALAGWLGPRPAAGAGAVVAVGVAVALAAGRLARNRRAPKTGDSGSASCCQAGTACCQQGCTSGPPRSPALPITATVVLAAMVAGVALAHRTASPHASALVAASAEVRAPAPATESLAPAPATESLAPAPAGRETPSGPQRPTAGRSR